MEVLIHISIASRIIKEIVRPEHLKQEIKQNMDGLLLQILLGSNSLADLTRTLVSRQVEDLLEGVPFER